MLFLLYINGRARNWKKNPSTNKDEMAKLFAPSCFLFLYLAVVAGPKFFIFLFYYCFPSITQRKRLCLSHSFMKSFYFCYSHFLFLWVIGCPDQFTYISTNSFCFYFTVALVETTNAENKVCFDNFVSLSAESCERDCKTYYKDHLLQIFTPRPSHPKCVCKFSCYQEKGDCICPF